MKKIEESKNMPVPGSTLGPANKFVEYACACACLRLVNSMIDDIDSEAMRLWQKKDDFSKEEIGMLFTLKSTRTSLYKIQGKLAEDRKAWQMSEDEIKKVRDYLNKFSL